MWGLVRWVIRWRGTGVGICGELWGEGACDGEGAFGLEGDVPASQTTRKKP